jgi:hypothetical protein
LLHGLIVLAILDWLKALAGPAAASQELEHGLRVVAMGMTAAVGGLIHFYAEKMAWSNEAGQYARMGTIFGDVLNALKSLGVDTGSAPAPGTAAFAAARMVVFELGKEALAESADWAMLHRERPIEIPPPGH